MKSRVEEEAEGGSENQFLLHHQIFLFCGLIPFACSYFSLLYNKTDQKPSTASYSHISSQNSSKESSTVAISLSPIHLFLVSPLPSLSSPITPMKLPLFIKVTRNPHTAQPKSNSQFPMKSSTFSAAFRTIKYSPYLRLATRFPHFLGLCPTSLAS